MKRARRIMLWALALLAVLAALAAASALLVLRTEWFREKVRQRIVREIETATGGRAELASFQFDWRAMEARVRGLVIRGTEPPDQAPLFRAHSILVGLKIISPFKQAVDIRSLTLSRPEIHIIVFPDGRTNLPAPKPPRPHPKSAVEQILDLAVDRFQLDDGLLLVEERRLPLSARGDGLRALFAYEPEAPRYRGAISFARLQTGYDTLKTLPLELEARLAIESARLELTHLRVGFQGSILEAGGAVENWADPHAGFDYRARLRLRELAQALGIRDAPQRGEATLEGRAEFSAGGYAVQGRLQAAGLAFQHSGLKLEGLKAACAFHLSPERIQLRDLDIAAAGGLLRGRAELAQMRDFRLEARLEDFPLRDLARAAGRPEPPFQGLISGPLRMSGRMVARRPADLEIGARLEIAPAQDASPLSGAIQADYRQRTDTLTLGPSYLATDRTRLDFTGVFGRRMEAVLRTTDFTDLERALALVQTRPGQQIPLRLVNGSLAFRGVVLGAVEQPQLEGRLRLESFEFEGRRFDRLEADLSASAAAVQARGLRLAGQGLTLSGAGRLGLQDWKPVPASPLEASFSLQAAEASALLAQIGQKLPVSGELAAGGKLSGTWAEPRLQARLDLSRAVIYEQPIERLRVEARYGDRSLEILPSHAETAAGRLRFSGLYKHRQEDPREGRLRFQLATEGLLLSRVKAAAQALAGLDAGVRAELEGELELGADAPRLCDLDGTVNLEKLTLDNEPLGELTLRAAAAATDLTLSVRGKLAGAALEGESRWKLEGDYPGSGTVSFARMQFSSLLARLGVPPGAAHDPQPGATQKPPALPFEGFIEGRARFQAAALQAKSWKATLELSDMELRPSPERTGGAPLALRNQGPLLVELDAGQARIHQARLVGKETELALSGTVAFNSSSPFDLRLKGGLNLALLQELQAGLRAGGKLTLDASLRGSLERPDLYGRVEFQNASLGYGDLPNSLDKLNGVVLLYRDRATIEKLTAESGGGKVGLEGFVAFGERSSYWLHLRASEVRVRYPEGVSSTVNAALAFTGGGNRSVLSGDITVTRAAFHPQTDLGSMLLRSSQTVQAPPSGPLFEGMRLDVYIRTAPQVRLETSLTRSIQAEADLRMRGSPLRPALLGRALISQGEILFFGNRYTIDSGEILFINPSRIEPVVNLNLQTRVRGVEVTLNVNGPLAKTTVTYRSDPPLPFSDIVALLATGRAPSTAPGLVGARSEFAQSWEQAGAGALVSQAVTSPLAGRLQRFLGVSRLKIDPSVRGIENTPEAHLTLEQQIGPDVTLVYITNLARAQQQTIRLEWDFTRNWSALAVREANGLFGVDFLYKRRFK